MSPTFRPIHHLTQAGRTHAPALLGDADDPHAELLSLVWGPRFDREHVQRLLARRPGYVPQVLDAVGKAADQFDRLAAAQQRRVRQLILRHRRRWDNAQAAY